MLNFLFTKTPLMFLVQDFWRDEAFSYILAKKNILDLLIATAKDFNPPLYYLILHIWIALVGKSEIALRSISLIFFVLMIYIVVDTLIEVFHFSNKKTLFYTLIFFLNPLLMYYAFEARMYSMFGFFVALSFYAFFTKKKKLYLVSTVLGLYTHYFMLFALLVQGLSIYRNEKHIFHTLFLEKKWSKIVLLFKSVLVPFIFFLPWCVFVLTQKQLTDNGFWILRVSFKDIIFFPALLYSGYERQLFFMEENTTYMILFILSIIIVALTVYAGIKVKNHKKETLFYNLFIWAFVPSGLLFLLSFIYPVFLPRYLIICSVGLLFLVVFGLEQLPFNKRVGVFLVLMFFTLYYQHLQIKYRYKMNVSPMYKEIKAMAMPTDELYVSNELDYFVAEYYFDENKVFIYNKSYAELPSYIGKVLIPRSHITTSLPTYPKRAIIIGQQGNTYQIQSAAF